MPVKKIIEVIKSQIELINFFIENNYDFAEEVSELNGMFTCLNEFNTGRKFYCIKNYKNSYEFGYYDGDKWISIAGTKKQEENK